MSLCHYRANWKRRKMPIKILNERELRESPECISEDRTMNVRSFSLAPYAFIDQVNSTSNRRVHFDTSVLPQTSGRHEPDNASKLRRSTIAHLHDSVTVGGFSAVAHNKNVKYL